MVNICNNFYLEWIDVYNPNYPRNWVAQRLQMVDSADNSHNGRKEQTLINKYRENVFNLHSYIRPTS